MSKKDTIIALLCIVISLIFGIASEDYIIGSIILATSLLCAIFASKGERINYIMGFINYLLMGYVALENNLYGIFLFYVFLFMPLQVWGFISWGKEKHEDDTVKIREFTYKNSIIIITSCIIGSFILGYLLTLIPGQRLAFMDSSSNCINLCGIVLMALRFKESWWIWLINNIIDLGIWLLTFISNGEGAFMMLLSSIAYLVINVYGIISWSRNIKKED